MKLTFDEEQLLKGIKTLEKSHVIKLIENLNTDSEELKEVKRGLLVKLNKCTDAEIKDLIMDID